MREMTDAARSAILRRRSDSCDLIYMDLPDGAVRLALAMQPIFYPASVGGDDQPYIKTGGAIVPGAAEETSDLDGQGQEIQFAAVDPENVLVPALLQADPFNRDFRNVRVHFHDSGPDAGKVMAAYIVFAGKINGEIQVDDLVGEGIEPGTVLVRFRAMSPLALLDVVRCIKTNPESHQRHYPGDNGMRYVQRMQNHKVNWVEVSE